MNLNKTIILSFFIGGIMITNAQIKSGRAYYTSNKKMNTLLDSTKYDKETIDQVQGYFSKQFQKEYILEFNQDKSVFLKKRRSISEGNLKIQKINCSKILRKAIIPIKRICWEKFFQYKTP